MIGIIVIVYCSDPEPLFRSVEDNRVDKTRWYIFFHGHNRDLFRHLQSLCRQMDARLFRYFSNRGLARSWNDGIVASLRDNNHITMLVNDDLFFYPNGFNQFIDFVKTTGTEEPNHVWCTPYGLETESFVKGEVDYQQSACCALSRAAVEQIGFFDENFYPAYYEDSDYERRSRLAGLPLLVDERVLVEHARSNTVRRDLRAAAAVNLELPENTRYYLSKWGGLPYEEQYSHPFNDPAQSIYIGAARRRTPHGPQHDRHPITRKFRSKGSS